jgi:hypothetical protein
MHGWPNANKSRTRKLKSLAAASILVIHMSAVILGIRVIGAEATLEIEAKIAIVNGLIPEKEATRVSATTGVTRKRKNRLLNPKPRG